jgi:putative salt-induced outer membrane protein YdiY
MNLALKISTVILLGVFWALNVASADELHLVNGDIITGKAVRMEDQKLIFKTDYAGEITVDWPKVARLITDDAIKVILSDGTVLEGFTRESAEGMMRLETEKLEVPSGFKLTEIQAINPVEKPIVKITARTNVGITSEKGNTDTDSFLGTGDFIARTVKSRYSIGGELTLEETAGVTTAENWLAFGDYNYFLAPKWFLYANTLLEHDEFADLDLRSTIGVGAGYQFFESPTLNLSAAAGPAYINEDYIEAEDDNFSAGQWLINYDQYFLKKVVQLFHNQTGYIDISDSKNWLIKTRQGLRFPIYKGLTATFQYNYDYNNEPSPSAKERWDSKLMFLLGWQFQN